MFLPTSFDERCCYDPWKLLDVDERRRHSNECQVRGVSLRLLLSASFSLSFSLSLSLSFDPLRLVSYEIT